MNKRFTHLIINRSVRPVFLMSFSLLLFLFACATKKTDISAIPQMESFPMKRMLELEKSIKEPKFRGANYNIITYGAVADGKTMATESIRKAILACSKDGGGKVIVPAGKFLSGPIHLENNVNLHLMEGAEILFSTNPDDFYPLVHTSFEGMELMNYSPLIYAKNKKNIAVTGKGILNGQASNDNWWTWKGSAEYGFKPGMPSQLDPNNLPKLMEMADTNVPVSQRTFGNGRYLRPNFIEPFECENVLIQGITIINAPFWILHPIKSKNIIVDGVNIRSHGPNNDGCDPEYSQNVLIKNSIFNTGDDCIAIKAGRDEEGRRVGIMTENVIVRDCKMIDGHGGVVIGSEMSAGVRNVFVYNNHMDSPELDRAIRLKTNNVRGGVVDGVFVKNLTVGQVKEAVLHITMNYKDYKNRTGNFTPQIRNILLEDVKVKNGGKYAIFADGLENSKIHNITFKNVTIDKVKANFNVKSVENLKLINTKINGAQTEYTPN
ncbi:glycoside hydrolase family 28 protein [Chryseobacterium sp. VAUSW3]|uniref:glycoside hydrolase family 28 protein n=1 Tax=Chryseobacterium sp. VAUSW3 TaxID=2010998 RepID=UPI000B4D591A|nr:glycoside hydrolase family 28 protein [Chryseobacterium sp. VAUSW3]OWR15105.1 glycoside hydrolase [Chryseobacterium sp. VAUSW3]